MAKPKRLNFTGDRDADELLARDPFALMIGMLLDQQVPMEWAFSSPAKLRERLGGDLDPAAIASMDPAKLEEIFKGPPALHRYPGSMAKRVQAMSQHLVEHHGGDAAAVWEGVDDASDLRKRLEAIPGWGKQKAQIFLALLGKQVGVTPQGWEEAAGDYGKPGYRSIADVVDEASLQKVRDTKKAAKANKA